MKAAMTPYKKFKNHIFRIIQIGNKEDAPSRAFDIFIAGVIIINIVLMVLQTFSEMAPIAGYIRVGESVTVIIFCIEYVLRIWTADCLFPNEKKGKAILKFLISYDGVVDLLTILPFFFLSGFVAFRMLRVVRIFHLFRINNQYDSFNVIKTVLKEKRNQIFSSLFILLIIMLASSIGMYSAEHEAQPEAFKNAFSGIWWSVSALLTVGYGDIYPITVMGKIMAILTAFAGVGVVAIPTGIISAGFVEQYTKIKNISKIERDNAVRFITIPVTADHNWNGVCIKDTNLPKGINIALIMRGDEVVIPKGDKVILENDKVVLSAEDYDEKDDLKFQEIYIGAEHPYKGKAIRELDISRLTTIVSIKRADKGVIPNGSTVIEEGDVLIIYTKAV